MTIVQMAILTSSGRAHDGRFLRGGLGRIGGQDLGSDQSRSRRIKADQGRCGRMICGSGSAAAFPHPPKASRPRRTPRTQACVGTICSTCKRTKKWNCKYLGLRGIKPNQGGSRWIAESGSGMRKMAGNLQSNSNQLRLNPGDDKLKSSGNCSTAPEERPDRRANGGAGWFCALMAIAVNEGFRGTRGGANFRRQER